MTAFQTYLILGFQHILNVQAIDHLLFILSITCIYTLTDVKRIVYLVTAFTLGHSLTLGLATLHIISFDAAWIEFLIPCTILFAAIRNLLPKNKKTKNNASYYIVLFFGLIHGLGFSNYLQSLLGQEASIALPLFAFNVGLEIGQLIIVSIILIISTLFINGFRLKPQNYILVLSGIIIGFVLPMIFARWA